MKVMCSETDEVGSYVSPHFDTLTQEILAQRSYLRFKARGQSMRPFIHSGDALLIEPRDGAKLKIGDVILYRRPSGTYVVHRLIKKNGSAVLITKGDSLNYYDASIPAEQVMGRVIQIEGRGRLLRLQAGPSRAFGWLLAWLARGRNRNRIRLMRNLSRVWWFLAGKRVT